MTSTAILTAPSMTNSADDEGGFYRRTARNAGKTERSIIVDPPKLKGTAYGGGAYSRAGLHHRSKTSTEI